MKPIDIPICLGGYISPVDPSLCMDGATHLLNTPIVGSIRIKAANDETRKALDELCSKEVSAVVCGYPRSSVNCQHLEAYHASEAEMSAPKLKDL